MLMARALCLGIEIYTGEWMAQMPMHRTVYRRNGWFTLSRTRTLYRLMARALCLGIELYTGEWMPTMVS